MSFSNDVRKEICSSVNDKDRRFACLYGMLMFCRTLTENSICFQSESRTSAELFCSLFAAVLKSEPVWDEHTRKNGTVLYTCEVKGSDAEAVFRKYRIAGNTRVIDSEIIATNSLGVFTAGVFLACGSVNDPSKEYHLEFACPEGGLASQLATLLHDIGVTAKTMIRRGQNIVYIKGSESIEDTLTFIGAPQCTLELMNMKIYKDIRNKANRIANCDAANIDKVVKAAMKQIEDIKLIDKVIGLDELSDELREVAQLRLDNIDMSLQEIGETLSEPISRSGVNHRFKKLAKMADELRMGGAESEK
ncbi:DNA-binding protein WhiA [Ruminococcus sp.]|uniref:DNA-binding protein WhiA n=1 Tax=Ruminococcus sp. TaxID=41978 RepID=UPI002CB8EF69|nr:DNA-binding protein WhiA [Ruminococcus sp.]HNZ98212.1 DNA-binding protein WhiA [Ruminococcus sp.]HOH87178.1 DNA-binding protein WhiA [Ruminococcus sp.]